MQSDGGGQTNRPPSRTSHHSGTIASSGGKNIGICGEGLTRIIYNGMDFKPRANGMALTTERAGGGLMGGLGRSHYQRAILWPKKGSHLSLTNTYPLPGKLSPDRSPALVNFL